MAQAQVPPRVVTGFPFQRIGFRLMAQLEKYGCQIGFGFQGTGVIRAGTPDVAFEHFSKNHLCLLELTLP